MQHILSVASICVVLCFSVSVVHAVGENLTVDIASSSKNTQKSKKSILFSSSSTVFSLSDDLQINPDRPIDQDNYSAKAEIWSKGAWGLSGNIQQNALNVFGLPEGSDSKRIDVNRKLFSAHNSDSYLAFGFGWQSFDIDNGLDSEGLNFSLLGKYSVTKNLGLYGNGTLFQSFDTSSQENIEGFQLEAGLNYQLGSRLSFTAGLKISDLESQLSSQQNIRQRRGFSSTFLIGTHLSF